VAWLARTPCCQNAQDAGLVVKLTVGPGTQPKEGGKGRRKPEPITMATTRAKSQIVAKAAASALRSIPPWWPEQALGR